MIVRQEEGTPIGDFFHDSGVKTIFNAIELSVDEFEVDTEKISFWADAVIFDMKNLKNQLKKVEAEEIKRQRINELNDMKKRGVE